MKKGKQVILAVSILICAVLCSACAGAGTSKAGAQREAAEMRDETAEPREESGGPEDTGMPEAENGPVDAGTTEEETPRHDSGEDMLVIVDFQNVYLPGQPWACPTMEQAMANTLDIVNSPDAPDYVLTKYLPPENPTGCWVRYNEEYADINADPFLAAFPDRIQQIATDSNVIEKSVYSSLDSAQMQEMLAGKKRVVLAGVVAECCVLATMLDAVDLGFEVVYLSDCVAGSSPEYEQQMLHLTEVFSPVHMRVMSSREYLRSIAPQPDEIPSA